MCLYVKKAPNPPTHTTPLFSYKKTFQIKLSESSHFAVFSNCTVEVLLVKVFVPVSDVPCRKR